MDDKKKKVAGPGKNKKAGFKKLTPQEVELAVEKIRENYDRYMVRYVKNRKERDAFEDRYLEARKARVHLDRFIIEELKWIKHLEGQAEAARREERRNSRENGGGGEEKDSNKKSFADKVLEELRTRIDKYPFVGLGAEEVYDVDKLYGALGVFERNYWPQVDKIYRRVYPTRYSGPRIIIENQLFDLTEPAAGRFPPRLQNLIALLGRFPRNYRDIEWESKQCILTASFFLHTTADELATLKEEDIITKAQRETVEKAYNFVHTVIVDFRLTDLKEKK
ncbi:MAG: hypothetical protein ACLFQW_08320 [Spirochaetaceae bacterium]